MTIYQIVTTIGCVVGIVGCVWTLRGGAEKLYERFKYNNLHPASWQSRESYIATQRFVAGFGLIFIPIIWALIVFGKH